MAQPGEQYRLTAEEGLGKRGDPGYVKSGQVVTVREVVAAADAGAHDDAEDAVVVEFDAPTLGEDEHGAPAVVTATRAFSVGVGAFADLFEAVTA